MLIGNYSNLMAQENCTARRIKGKMKIIFTWRYCHPKHTTYWSSECSLNGSLKDKLKSLLKYGDITWVVGLIVYLI